MKKLLTLLILLAAFVTHAAAQWNQDPKIRETHWFGVYEYQDYEIDDFTEKSIDFDGNYLRSITIAKTHTGQDWALQHPKTSFYSWLDHKYRFSVGNTGAWGFRKNVKHIYSSEGRAYGELAQVNEYLHYDGWDGLSLTNVTTDPTTFTILNLKAGDKISIEYYRNTTYNPGTVTFESGSVSGLSQGTEVVSKTEYEVTADCDVTLNIPGKAMIRDVVITLAKYQASDFKVEEISGQAAKALTDSHDAYLASQGVGENDPRRRFGTVGYKYSFKGPGVLEDKRGAAPYITMKFGNDNDMTFVRALAEVNVNWGGLVSVTPSLYTKNGGETDITESTATIIDGEEVYVVQSYDKPENGFAWDTQFWIGQSEYPLPVGQKYKVTFKYKADAAATVTTQTHTAPGAYKDWRSIGDVNFTTSWQTFEATVDIVNETAGWQYIAFNLNELATANKYYFKDISLQISEKTETISAEDLGAASIIHESNNLDPSTNGKNYLQWRYTFKEANNWTDGNLYSNAEIRDKLVGKEWSTFTADHPWRDGVDTGSNGQWVYNNGGVAPNPETGKEHEYEATATNYVYGDIFPSIWPLCGNFFYFFPEVDGLLKIDYYCEGYNETNAFWFKQDADGVSKYVPDQPIAQHINQYGQNKDNSRTDGGNNYSMMVQVERGGIYYLCSLPTNITHEHPVFRLKSYTFIPIFRVEPLYKVVHNTEVNTSATQKVAKIVGGPYCDLDGVNRNFGSNSYDVTQNTFTRNAEQEPRVKCLGNVVSAKAYIEFDGTDQWLSLSDIVFRTGYDSVTGEAYNPGGAVVVHLNNDEGQASFVLTIAYDAANAKWAVVDGKDQRVAATEGGKAVKHWDFYSGKGDYITKRDGAISYNGATTGYTSEMNSGWDLGKYGTDDGSRYATNQSDWLAKSKLFKETHKADGLTSDWEIDWVDVPNQIEPIFKSIYDMEADNADMIHETAGLVFFTEPNELGIYNENDAPTSAYQDRFIGLMGGGKLIIPRLKANDRVVIKMGCFGNAADKGESEFEQKAVLWLNNAKDAMGNTIPTETDYIIGGSEPFAEPADAKMFPHGEYHFIVANNSDSDDQDFTIQLKEGGLLKIYSIDIYRNAANNNADILTENMVTGVEPEMLFTDQDSEAKDAVCYLRYSGWQEKSEFHSLDQVRGNLGSITKDDFQGEEFTTQPYWKYTQASAFEQGDFGSFRAEMAVKTKDNSNTFVTDYAPGCMAVDYLETKTYPYTWDFTDLEEYGADDAIDAEKGRTDLLADYNGWKVGSGETATTGLRNAPETEPGILFANGGQIYASNKMFEEAAGIGLKRSIEDPDDAKLLNNSVNITSDGLVLNSTKEGVFHKLVIPKNVTLPTDVSGNAIEKAAVYVRATPIKDAKLVKQCSTDGKTGTPFANEIEVDGGDVIYVMEMPANKDAELWLNGMTVKKIGVSVDPKTLNKYGWQTESRERMIDPELTAYFTGQPIASFIVRANNISLSNMSILLDQVYPYEGNYNDGTRFVMNQAIDDDNNAYILYNRNTDKDKKEVKILNDGFHMFVPDMHDNPEMDQTNGKTPIGESLLKSVLKPGTKVPMSSEDDEGVKYTNYVLTYSTAKASWEDGSDIEQGSANDDIGGVGFYRVQPKGVTCVLGHQGYLPFLTSDVKPNSSSSCFTLVFDGDDIDSIGNMVVGRGDAEPVYYNLWGQKLNGVPTQRGIYIVNGKKITVK